MPQRTWPALGAVVTILLVAFVPLLVIAVMTGSWGVPQIDDWDFSRAALTLHATGHLRLTGWGEMTLVGQILLSQPLLYLHPSVGTLDGIGLASATALVVSVWLVARTLLDRRWALLAAAVAAFCPLVAMLSMTFMTDLPSAALQGVCIALGALSFARGSDRAGGYSPGLFVAAMAVGLVACTIRETAIAAPAAVALVGIWQSWRSRRRLIDPVLCISGLVVVTGLVAVVAWRRTQPGAVRLESSLFRSPFFVAAGMFREFSFLALFVLPILLVLPWARLLRGAGARWTVVGLLVAIPAALTAWRLADAGRLFTGALLLIEGPPGQGFLAGTRPALFKTEHWDDLQRLAAVSLGMLVLAGVAGLGAFLRRRGGRGAPMPAQGALLIVATITLTIGVVVAIPTSEHPFDRYVIPLLITVPALIGWIGQATSRAIPRPNDDRRTILGTAPSFVGVSLLLASLVLLGSVGFIESASADAYDAARWRAGEILTAEYPATNPDRLDAGDEWVGFHAPLPLRRPKPRDDLTFYERSFGLQPCVVVSNSRTLPSGNSTGRHIGRPLTTWTDVYGNVHELFVFRVADCGPR